MGSSGKLWLGVLAGSAVVFVAVYALAKLAGPRAGFGLGQLVDAHPKQVPPPRRPLTEAQFKARANARSYDLEV